MRPRPPAPTSLAERRRKARARHARRVAALVVLSVALLVTLLLTAFGSSPTPVRAVAPAPAARLLPAGPPQPQVLATVGPLKLQLPVPQSRLTAIGYHPAPDDASSLTPVGHRANRGLVSRLFHRVFGGGGSGQRWYQLGGSGAGGPTSMADVGAAPGTDVYSPVDGSVVGVTRYVIDGRARGVELALQPLAAPSYVVELTRLRLDPSLRVGDTVQAGTSKVGTVIGLARLEQQQLARYTQDAGDHVSIEVRTATDQTLP
jgi:hypothetical protein